MAFSTLRKDFTAVINDDDIQQLKDCDDEQLRIVLIGKTGSGKSTTGNTIIGKSIFFEDMSASSVTRKCETYTVTRFGTKIRIIDTPGLFDTGMSPQNLQREISRCILMASPGPHVFILVLRIGRFTDEERDAVRQLQEMFGEEARKHTVIVFTGRDSLDRHNKMIHEYVSTGDEFLKALVEQCPYTAFNNVDREDHQVEELLRLIKRLIGPRGMSSYYFTNQDFNNAKKAMVELKTKQKEKEGQQMQNYLQGIMKKNSQIEANIASEKEKVKILQRDFEKTEQDKRKQLQENEAEVKRLKQQMTNHLGKHTQDVTEFQRVKEVELNNLQSALDKQRKSTAEYQQNIETGMNNLKTQHADGIRQVTQNNERRLKQFKESVKKTFPGELVMGPCSINGSPFFTISFESSSRKFYITRDGESRLDCIPGYNGLKIVQSTAGGCSKLCVQTLQGQDQVTLTM